jgi:hypothetical protein
VWSKTKALLPGILLSALVAGAGYLILGSGGVVTRAAGLDLSFWLLSFYVFAGMLAASTLVRVLVPRSSSHGSWWTALASLLFWAGLTQLAYFLLHGLGRAGSALEATKSYRHAGEIARPYLATIQQSGGWVACSLGVMAVYWPTAFYWNQRKYATFHPLLKGGTVLVLGAIAWRALASLEAIGGIYPGLGAVVFAAFFGICLTRIAEYGRYHTSPVISQVAGWVTASAFRNANIGAFAVLYAVFTRPALYSALVYAPLLEAAAVAAIGLYFLRRPSEMVKKTSEPAAQPLWLSWRRHQQVVAGVPDQAFERVVAMQHALLSTGDRSPMVTHLTTTLSDNGVPLDLIAHIVTPLVHHDEKVPGKGDYRWMALIPGENSRRAARNMRRREQVHQEVQSALEELYPRLDLFDPQRSQPDGEWKQAEAAFLQKGERAELATLVAVEAWHRHLSQRDASSLVDRVLEYQDRARRWYDPPWADRKRGEENLRQRTSLIDILRSQTPQSEQSVAAANPK